jgi:DNA-binding NarL/FixJ family response regulator
VLLQLEPDIEVVGDAENGKQALELFACLEARAQLPRVVLMDIRMPVMDGVATTQAIRSAYPKIKILILSTFDDESYVGDALRAGAWGYLLKDTPSEELAEAIRSIGVIVNLVRASCKRYYNPFPQKLPYPCLQKF